MKSALANIIHTIEHTVETLNLERDHELAINHQRDYDLFIHDLGKIRMQARVMLQMVKYGEDE